MEKVIDQNWKLNYDLRTILEQIDSNKTFKDKENLILDWKSYPGKNVTELEKQKLLCSIELEGSKYVGLLNYNLKRDYVGMQIYSNKDIYIGQWENGIRHGNGCYIHYKEQPKGKKITEVFMGRWINNKPDKEGIYTWTDESTKNDDIQNCDFQSFVGEFNESNFKRGVYLTIKNRKFYIYYGSFEQNRKFDDNAFLYDNDLKEDRIFLGKIKNDEPVEGFFVSFHKEQIDNTLFIKFENGKPNEVTPKEKLKTNINKKLDEDCVTFRECLYEDDWFGSIYEKINNLIDLVKNIKMEDFNNEKSFNNIVENIFCFEEVQLYSILCSKLSK